MSASSRPTLRPRSRRPSAILTAVVDLPTPPLPEATAMMALTPGTPAARAAALRGPRRCRRRRPGCRRRRSARGAACGAGRALRRQRDHDRGHAGQRLDGRFGALADRLPGLHHRGIDGDREENLAVGNDDRRTATPVFGQRDAFGRGTRARGSPERRSWSPPWRFSWLPHAGPTSLTHIGSRVACGQCEAALGQPVDAPAAARALDGIATETRGRDESGGQRWRRWRFSGSA